MVLVMLLGEGCGDRKVDGSMLVQETLLEGWSEHVNRGVCEPCCCDCVHTLSCS